MKEASCHDEKMEAYCNAVRRFEDKFVELELNHIARKYNEEADQLAKITSGRTTVPLNIFSRDLAKPSVDFKNPEEAVGAAPGPSGDCDHGAIGQEPLDEGARGHGHKLRDLLCGQG